MKHLGSFRLSFIDYTHKKLSTYNEHVAGEQLFSINELGFVPMSPLAVEAAVAVLIAVLDGIVD